MVRNDTLSLDNPHLRWNVQIHRLQNDCLLQDLYGQASTACQSKAFLICSSSVAQLLVVGKQIEYLLPGGPVSFRRHKVNKLLVKSLTYLIVNINKSRKFKVVVACYSTRL